MFSENSEGISIDILGKTHKFACASTQVTDLTQAANDLAAMCEKVKAQKNMSNEQALLVAAVNLSYSLLKANTVLEESNNKQQTLIEKLTCAL